MFKHQAFLVAFEMSDRPVGGAPRPVTPPPVRPPAASPGAPAAPAGPTLPGLTPSTPAGIAQRIETERTRIANGDSNVSLEEFVTDRLAHSSDAGAQAEQARAQLQAEFQRYDADHDNSLSVSEFASLVENRVQSGGEFDMGTGNTCDAADLTPGDVQALNTGVTENGPAVQQRQTELNAWLAGPGQTWANSAEGRAALAPLQGRLAEDGKEGPRTRAAMAAMRAATATAPAAATPPAGGAAPTPAADSAAMLQQLQQVRDLPEERLVEMASSDAIVAAPPQVRQALVERLLEGSDSAEQQRAAGRLVASMIISNPEAVSRDTVGQLSDDSIQTVSELVGQHFGSNPAAQSAQLAQLPPGVNATLVQRMFSEGWSTSDEDIAAVAPFAAVALQQNPACLDDLMENVDRMRLNLASDTFTEGVLAHMSDAQLTALAQRPDGRTMLQSLNSNLNGLNVTTEERAAMTRLTRILGND